MSRHRISLEVFLSCDIVNRVNLSCDGLNYSKSFAITAQFATTLTHRTHTLPHSKASWRHVRHAKISVRSARTHVLAAKLSLIPPRPTLSWFICTLFRTTLTSLHTHAHTHSLAEIALLRAQAKNIDDKHFRAFPAYIIYANISLLCLATGSLIRKILTQKSSHPSLYSLPSPAAIRHGWDAHGPWLFSLRLLELFLLAV